MHLEGGDIMNSPRQVLQHLLHGLARPFGLSSNGASGIASPESGPVVEFVASHSRRPMYSSVQLRMVPAHPGTLVADPERNGCVRASCTSLGSIRFRGRFRRGTHVRLAADGPVQVIARSEGGEILAGPMELRPEHPWAELQW